MGDARFDQRLAELAGAAAALSGELDLDSVLQTVVDVAARVTAARYAALGVLGVAGEAGTLVRFITAGVTDAQVRAIGPYPTGKGLLGELIRHPHIVRLERLQDHPSSYGFPPNHPPMSTFLGAPVAAGGRAYGNLYLTEKPGGFDVADEQVIAVLAAQAGAAIENALLSARLRELAVHEERERISRDIHDGAIQRLFSVGMGLQSARALVAVDASATVARIDSAIDLTDDTIRELRGAIYNLRSTDAATLGLARGLAELAREHEVNALVRPTLDLPTDLDARVPGALVPDLLAITREALTNAAKHARARNASVTVTVADATVRLRVTDDGGGFDPAAVTPGRGLGNIAERVAGLGGTLTVDSDPRAGTRVDVVVPVPEEGP